MIPDLIATNSPDVVSVAIPTWIDYSAVVVGSVSGLLVAQERKLDLVGHVGLAILCGLGGGLIRDTIMQVGDVYMLNSPWPIMASLAASLVGFFFPGILTHWPDAVEWVDIVAVALFAVAGTDKAIMHGLNPAAVLLMGTMTAVGGGMLRDVFLGDVPRIFQRSNFYAICAIAGSAAYWLVVTYVHLDKTWATLVCLVVTVGLRRWSLRYNVYSPADVNLTPQVKRMLHHK